MLDVFPVSARLENDALVLGGVPAAELADRFGTPLVVYCEETLREQARSLVAAVDRTISAQRGISRRISSPKASAVLSDGRRVILTGVIT